MPGMALSGIIVKEQESVIVLMENLEPMERPASKPLRDMSVRGIQVLILTSKMWTA